MKAFLRQSERDLRVDFFRGLALWFIFVDHSESSVLRYLTIARFTLADAAEVFVLLAGYAAGLVYGRAFDRHGWLTAARLTVRRAAVIYVAHVFLVVVLAAVVSYADRILLGESKLITHAGLMEFYFAPFSALQQTLLLRLQPENADILPLYVALLLLLTVALPLQRRPVAMLAVSFTLYALAWTFGITFFLADGRSWSFNPLTWQLLFFIGTVFGYCRPGARRVTVPYVKSLFAASVVFLLITKPMQLMYYRSDLLPAVSAIFRGFLNVIAPVLPTYADKMWLHPLRLISVLALAYLLGHAVDRESGWLRGGLAAPFVLMGQNALPVFCASVPLSFLAHLAINALGETRWEAQVLVNCLGFSIAVAIAATASWFGRGGGQERGTSVAS